MNKKSFIKIAGVITTLLTLSSAAFSCHLFSKKTPEQKDSDKKNNENQNIIKEEVDKKDYIEMRTMYGIPMDENLKPQGSDTKTDEDIIIIEKYGIPFDPNEDKLILKYAVPKIVTPPKENIKKYAVPNNPTIAKYALPQYMDDNPPLLKYAMPYFPPEETDK